MRHRSNAGHQPPAPCNHAVHFYDQAYPADAASDFIAAGLRAGDACVLLLTAPHRRAVEQRLRAQGLRTDAQQGHRGSYRAIDTHQALAAIQVGGRLDLARACELLERLLAPPVDGSSARIRAVGDPAPTLLAAGLTQDAIALEAIVDRLAAAHGAEVFCAYPIADFCRQGHTGSLFEVCAEHTALAFPDRLWAQGFMPPRGGATSPAWPAAAGRTRS